MSAGLHIFRGMPPQAGNGIGGIFRALCKSLMPVAKKSLMPVAKKIGKETVAPAVLNAGAGYLSDLASGKSGRKSAKKRKSQALRQVQAAGKKALKKEATNFIASLAGVQSETSKSSSTKRKRKSSAAPSAITKKRRKTATAFDFV